MTELDHTIAYLTRKQMADLLSPQGYERSKKRREVRATSWADLKELIRAA